MSAETKVWLDMDKDKDIKQEQKWRLVGLSMLEKFIAWWGKEQRQ